MKLLLISNGKPVDGDYLSHAVAPLHTMIEPLLAQKKMTGTDSRIKACFIPYAGVTTSWDDYLAKVQTALRSLPIDIAGAHQGPSPVAAVMQAELIIVGGGNTFQLLHQCRLHGLLAAIQQKVATGTPYTGWSAGANLACPTIGTTNDMPIVDPEGFSALSLINFQINPHYNNELPAGHQGETRSQRIAEYLVANPTVRVLGLPEGDWLTIDGSSCTLNGHRDAIIFTAAGQTDVALQTGILF